MENRQASVTDADEQLSEHGTAAGADEPLSEHTTAGDLRLHSLIWGPADGPPVVLLHGLRGHAWTWERVATGLAPPYRLYALDFRGHGDSDWATEGYGTPRYATDVAAWLDARGLARVDVIGHSAGGRAAVALAADHPARVRRLVVVDIGPDIS